MTPRDLYSQMHDIADSCDDVNEVTRQWLKSMSAEEMAVLYFPLARVEVRNHLRNKVRGLEHRVFGGEAPAADESVSLPELRKQMLAQSVFVPGVGLVPWGEMTANQHMDRAEFLRKMAAGNIRSAEVHEQTAQELIAAGATCLDEIAA